MCSNLGTFVNPFTDFGFKRIFGSEESKPLLISFLNDLLDLEEKIVSIIFNKNEYVGMSNEDRKAIYDISCTDEKGSLFIVELQRVKQEYFQDRALYYTSFPVQEQAIRGTWNFNLTPIYFIGILDFEVEAFGDNYIHHGQIRDKYSDALMYDKLNFIYIELPKFKKKEKELSTHLEMWLWFFNTLTDLDEIPESFKGDIIEEAFIISELAKMKPQTRKEYEISLKHYRDWVNVLSTAKNESKEEGREEGKEEGAKNKSLEIAQKSLLKGLDMETIIMITGLSEDEITSLGKI
ncbi:MAG: Rpn family recombination-promoting nuclease/putative transposase [Sulfurovum sp.]|nr:Rpn family recombination-promoting nuclease/putative transposase [Sulfurovum sp.]